MQNQLSLSAFRRWRVGRWLLGIALLLASGRAATSQDLTRSELARLLMPKGSTAVQPPGHGEVERWLQRLDRTSPSDPLWWDYEFLAAELLVGQGRPREAVSRYFKLVETAASDPYHDSWGGSGLVAFAVYRWLQLQGEEVDTASFRRFSDFADRLLPARLVRSVVEPHPTLPSLPNLDDALYYQLATVALRANLPHRAGTYFLNYLSRMRSDRPSIELHPLYDVVTGEGGVSTEARIELFRGRRLMELNKDEAAAPHLQRAAQSDDPQTRLEARYLLARVAGTSMSRAEKSAIYQEVYRYSSYDDLAEKALFWDALQYGPRDPEFRKYLVQLWKQFPDGSLRDDALFWLAKGEQINGNLNAALDWYGYLRRVDVDNDFTARAALLPALALLWRQERGDLDRTREILLEFVREHPNSEQRPMAQFWLGRIAEEQRQQGEAIRMFEETVRVDRYGYYGVRARMHLDAGAEARAEILISDPAFRKELRLKYSQSAKDSDRDASQQDPYRRRLQAAVSSGLYSLALDGENLLRDVSSSKRLQDFTFEELDDTGLLSCLAVMMALRQDALAAADANSSLQERIALAQTLGDSAGDWPTAMALVHQKALASNRRRADLMSTAGYLRAAYPVVYGDLLNGIAAQYRVLPEILYAVMRQESYFYPFALSHAGALGLFQFMPRTFEERNQDWHLLEASGKPDPASYLFDAASALRLAARWFSEQKLPAFDGNLLFAALAHHSGDGRVKKWEDIWERQGWQADVEMMIESFRKPDFDQGEKVAYGVEARNFARRVISDLAIAEAIGLYQRGTTRSAALPRPRDSDHRGRTP
jgi:peptidoglycan lytic transglycosylase